MNVHELALSAVYQDLAARRAGRCAQTCASAVVGAQQFATIIGGL